MYYTIVCLFCLFVSAEHALKQNTLLFFTGGGNKIIVYFNGHQNESENYVPENNINVTYSPK